QKKALETEAREELGRVRKQAQSTEDPFEAIELWNRFLEGREGAVADEARRHLAALRVKGIGTDGVSRSDTAGVYINSMDGAEMVLVDRGKFKRGLQDRWKRAMKARYFARPDVEDEDTVAEIQMDAYYIYRFEVTNEQFARYLNARGSAQDTAGNPLIKAHPSFGLVLDKSQWKPVRGKERSPVVCVSWFGAIGYANWAGGNLPSEAQWEKAASWDAAAAEKRMFPWGVDYRQGIVVCADLWVGREIRAAAHFQIFEEQRGENPLIRPQAVDSHPEGRSPWGCYHMAGNVAEWCRDVYDREFYKSRDSRFDNPVRGGSGSKRSVRGGAWKNWCRDTRTTNRVGVKPENMTDDLGFRVMR
ncbi:MAG: formylglycine-generating enzyme family protein, partial [Planctomycetota bacterium]